VLRDVYAGELGRVGLMLEAIAEERARVEAAPA
jgi:hypothetical protein